MTLASLKLQNFRSYQKVSMTFSPGTTLIVGPNTAGKTNILEALSMLATGKSFRADSDREAIRWGREISRIGAEVGTPWPRAGQGPDLLGVHERSGAKAVTVAANGMPPRALEKLQLEMVLTTGEVQGAKAPMKKYLVNGVARRQVDFVGNLRVVLFWPEHLELVTDSPSLRRKYLDSVLVQVDREYRRNLYSYERGLRQRNKLLDLINEGTASRGQLLFWDQLLVKAGGYITDKREEFIHFVNSYQLSAISYQLEYDKSVISEARLVQYKDEEIAAKSTLVGPHRDDIVFYKKQETRDRRQEFVDLSKYGSRGEQRLTVLWLKFSELAYIEQEVGDRPVLLLDDIFSELDGNYRKLVLDVIGEQQTIITSAEEDVIDLLRKKRMKAEIIQL